jgi:hypothetical protein
MPFVLPIGMHIDYNLVGLEDCGVHITVVVSECNQKTQFTNAKNIWKN